MKMTWPYGLLSKIFESGSGSSMARWCRVCNVVPSNGIRGGNLDFVNPRGGFIGTIIEKSNAIPASLKHHIHDSGLNIIPGKSITEVNPLGATAIDPNIRR